MKNEAKLYLLFPHKGSCDKWNHRHHTNCLAELLKARAILTANIRPPVICGKIISKLCMREREREWGGKRGREGDLQLITKYSYYLQNEKMAILHLCGEI